MLHKAGLLCAALAVFSIAGGHWAVLQSVAWAGMLADYTRQSGSVVVAVEQTFDGEHPCALCQEIAAAKGREKARPMPSSLADAQKFKGAQDHGKCFATGEGFQPPRLTVCPALWEAPASLPLTSRGESPPVPPPRLGAA